MHVRSELFRTYKTRYLRIRNYKTTDDVISVLLDVIVENLKLAILGAGLLLRRPAETEQCRELSANGSSAKFITSTDDT